MKLFNQANSNIAKERLRLMLDSNLMDKDIISSTRMKEEISELLARYYDMSVDEFDIKIVIKPKKRI